VLISDYCRLQVLAASSGNFYNVAMAADRLYSVAGNGRPGFAGDGEPLAKTRFAGPISLLVTPQGGMVIGDGPRLMEIVR
jgi:hypothetical protein